MPQLLFEIGVEELPALAIEPAARFLKEDFALRLNKLKLTYSSIEAFGTPRRLVLFVEDLLVKQEDQKEEILGPSVSIAYGDNGSFTQSALGFINSRGLKESDIFRKTTDKGEVIAAVKVDAGSFTKDLLPSLLVETMRAIPFKKKMRWEASGEMFARPVRWLLCLFGMELVPLKFADVESGNMSRGHRFMSDELFLVTSKEQYLKELAHRFVMLSSIDRERAFVKGAEEKLAHIGAKFLVDQELMATVRNLFEYPFVILGKFDEGYLEIPHEILICEMKNHQKYFAVYGADGAMLPYFVCTAGTKPYDEEVFAKGNARVLRARFADGAFYFAKDREQPLRQLADGLSSLIFERELGTVKEKSLRIEKVALALGQAFGLNDHELETIGLAAPLVKADLVTGVVGQFPELQGVMGRIYALLDGEPKQVAEAIETHYWPRFAGDILPALRAAALLSLADKLDTLVGIVAIGKKPAGNKDPFALRRAAIGMVRLLVHFGFSMPVSALIGVSLESFGEQFRMEAASVTSEAQDFILQRARGLLIEDLGKENEDYAVNFADSALLVGSKDILDIFARAHTLYAMRMREKDEFDSVVQTFKRAGNIVKKAEASGEKYRLELEHIQYFVVPVEIDLLRAVEHAKNLAENQEKKGSFEALRSMYINIFSYVVMIKPKLDSFFDNVMVMADDKNVRNARLSLLSEIKQIADRIADFTHL
ncbi:MAG TPA: glycine--tRNA ligase subunit beta [Myxococcota bacterium]|nr:glycine--tRNA ligase subunit beta [Myxococcota bacterium]